MPSSLMLRHVALVTMTNGGATLLRNVGSYKSHTACPPRRLHSSHSSFFANPKALIFISVGNRIVCCLRQESMTSSYSASATAHDELCHLYNCSPPVPILRLPPQFLKPIASKCSLTECRHLTPHLPYRTVTSGLWAVNFLQGLYPASWSCPSHFICPNLITL
jgi:hypothetical protein